MAASQTAVAPVSVTAARDTHTNTPPSNPSAQTSSSQLPGTDTSNDSDFISPPKSQEYMDSLIPPSQEQFEHIAQVQEEKEQEIARKVKEQRHQSADYQKHQQEHQQPPPDEKTQAEAAIQIQNAYRGYRTRRELEGFGLDPTTRWVTALHEARFREFTRPRSKSTVDGVGDQGSTNGDGPRPTSAKDNWKKARIVARRAGRADPESDSSSSESDDPDATPEEKAKARERRQAAKSERRHEARMMGLQYFLEMVDLKHRYGSNLRSYHEIWKSSDSNENFFYWLDHGEGKNIELDSCPRERLEREQVRYLSREERQYYLVEVDDIGRLCWAKNGARIDTTEQYRDSIHGVVPADDPTPVFNPSAQAPPSPQDALSDSSSRSSLESKREADRAAKYATPGVDQSKGVKKVSHLSTSVIFDKLLRKSVKKNTWIFVADTSFHLYVGIKNSGAFQHSSFMQGSRIAAAGLIKIKNGRLSSLSPLSGHYRPPAANFRAFVHSLQDAGVDMSHVSISKSYIVLVGLETYVKTRRKGKNILGKMIHGRDKIVAPDEVRQREEEERDKSKSAAREREFLAQQREEEEKQRDENQIGVKVMQKLKIAPSEPRGQKGTDGEAQGGDK